jgi:hypothetical protein
MRKLLAALAVVCLFVCPLTAQHQGRGGEISPAPTLGRLSNCRSFKGEFYVYR